MSDSSTPDATRLATLVKQYRAAPTATAADRAVRDQLLDELQEAVGMGAKMVTEADVLRRAEKIIQGR